MKDKNTDEDLTSVTLAQIIFEEEKQMRGFLPLAALRRIIETGGESLTDLVNQISESAERVGRVFRREEKQQRPSGDVGDAGELPSSDPLATVPTQGGVGDALNLVKEWVDGGPLWYSKPKRIKVEKGD